ncbi:MAG: hypothetical protein ACE15F_23440 [bacterium]
MSDRLGSAKMIKNEKELLQPNEIISFYCFMEYFSSKFLGIPPEGSPSIHPGRDMIIPFRILDFSNFWIPKGAGGHETVFPLVDRAAASAPGRGIRWQRYPD